MIKKLTTYVKNFIVSIRSLDMVLMLFIAMNAVVLSATVNQGSEIFINHVSSVTDTLENQRELNEAVIEAMIQDEMKIAIQQKRLDQLEEVVRYLAAEYGYK